MSGVHSRQPAAAAPAAFDPQRPVTADQKRR